MQLLLSAEYPFAVRVEEVFDGVVGATGELGGHEGPLVAVRFLEVDHFALFLVGERSGFDGGGEVLDPT